MKTRASWILAIAAVAACKGDKTYDQPAPAPAPAPVPAPDPAPAPAPAPAPGGATFAETFTVCGQALATTPRNDFGPAFVACAPMVGTGGCRAAWDGAGTKRYPQLLTDLIAACAQQHCASLSGTKPQACAGQAVPEGKEVPVWTELHAAILGALFADPIKVSPEIVTRYKALAIQPTVDEFKAFQAEFATIDPAKATVDGREVVFGVAARQLSSVFFVPAAELSAQRPL